MKTLTVREARSPVFEDLHSKPMVVFSFSLSDSWRLAMDPVLSLLCRPFFLYFIFWDQCAWLVFLTMHTRFCYIFHPSSISSTTDWQGDVRQLVVTSDVIERRRGNDRVRCAWSSCAWDRPWWSFTSVPTLVNLLTWTASNSSV